MTAIKKNITKSAASPAPATKTAAAKPAPKKKNGHATAAAPSPVASTSIASAPAAPTRIAAPAASIPPVQAQAPSPVKAVATKPVVTTVAARIDVGFGNVLFIRGEGPGLSWDQGRAMNCIANDLWQITLPESVRPHTFKFLINDSAWSTGPDFTATPGSSVTLTPEFQA